MENPMLLKTELEQGKGPTQRAAVLWQTYRRLSASIGLASAATAQGNLKWAEPRVAHPMLLRLLQSDPSVCAILPTAQVPIALGLSEDAPFFISRSGLLSMPPVLLGNSSALAAA